jgi:hypothetical protein
MKNIQRELKYLEVMCVLNIIVAVLWIIFLLTRG